MHREYHAWFSPALNRQMELLVFGHAGARVVFFPTRRAHFYDYEGWGVVEALRPKLEAGHLQLYCVDSIDGESFYCRDKSPAARIARHQQYEDYILNEVLPLTRQLNPNMCLVAAGCSMGAYHAVNLAFRHPQLFGKVLAMSGRYDLTQPMGCFRDLFEGYVDEQVYLHTPNRFLAHLTDEFYLAHLRRLNITLAVGEEDAFLLNNQVLSHQLHDKGIGHQLHIWAGEAHKPVHWQRMVDLYL